MHAEPHDFELGQTREIQLVPIVGARVICGFNSLVMGLLKPRRVR